jgi:hypothetical protein
MARKFLYFVGLITMLIIAGAFALRIWGDEISQIALVPTVEFQQQRALADTIYAKTDMWYARPEITGAKNPAMWLPAGVKPQASFDSAVFFIHPTSYLTRDRWNAPLNDKASRDRAEIFLRGQATAFNNVGNIWAPRYRQAAIGAFLTNQPEGQQAIEAAYRDVLLAFDSFLATVPADKPIILAGHSQGALHLTRLLNERVAQDPRLAGRIVAAYVIGWPVSVDADLPALGLPACDAPEQFGCIMAWNSFAEPADYTRIVEVFDATRSIDGRSRAGSRILCTNPLTGTRDAEAPMAANLGTLVPNDTLSAATIVKQAVPARCDERGFLLIGDPPDLGPYVLPGNNYHVYDFSLFWMNIRADTQRRLDRFLGR